MTATILIVLMVLILIMGKTAIIKTIVITAKTIAVTNATTLNVLNILPRIITDNNNCSDSNISPAAQLEATLSHKDHASTPKRPSVPINSAEGL